MTIGERIQEARKRAGYTQKQLAQKASVAAVTVQQYERGVRQPRLEPLRRIALALGTTVNELVEPSYWAAVSKEEFEESGCDLPAVASVYFDRINALEQINSDCERLNDDGVKLVAEVAHLTAESPRYRLQAPSQGTPEPDAPPTSSEDK